MPKGFIAALKLGFGAPIWTLNKRSFAGGVLPAFYGFHYLEHMLGVIFPVRGHMQHTIGYHATMHQINKLRLNDTTLMMLLFMPRSEEHTSELQSRGHLVCRLLLEKKKQTTKPRN